MVYFAVITLELEDITKPQISAKIACICSTHTRVVSDTCTWQSNVFWSCSQFTFPWEWKRKRGRLVRCCRCVVHCYVPACHAPRRELLSSCTVHCLLCQTVLTVQIRHRHTDSNIVICVLYLACLRCWVDAGCPTTSPWTISADHYTYNI